VGGQLRYEFHTATLGELDLDPVTYRFLTELTFYKYGIVLSYCEGCAVDLHIHPGR